MNSVRTTWMKEYAIANSRPWWAKAFGMAADINRPASISRNISIRTVGRSGSIQLVNQQVYIHTHHTDSSRKPVCKAPLSDRGSANECESCVTANTNTRSKNSSTLVTRACDSRERNRDRRVV